MSDRSAVLIVADHLRRPVPGGIGTYTAALIEALLALPPSERPPLRLFASRRRPGGDPLSSFGLPVTSSALSERVLSRLFEFGFPHVGDDAAVVHATSLFAPPTDAALTVAVHDIAFRSVPEAFSAHGRRWHERAFHRVVRRAACLIVPSELTATAIRQAAPGVGEERIALVEYGADHLGPPDDQATDDFLRSHGVPGEFLCSVGTLEPRKNLLRLFDAYEKARPAFPEPWPLVVVGPAGWGERLAPRQGVVLAGQVSPPVLAGLYRRARLVAYVPLIEGFGLPVAEAMNSGAPVVCSPVPSSRGAGFEVDPSDTEEIAEALAKVATVEALRAELIGRGQRRAGELTWARTAHGNLQVWRRLIGER